MLFPVPQIKKKKDIIMVNRIVVFFFLTSNRAIVIFGEFSRIGLFCLVSKYLGVSEFVCRFLKVQVNG